MLRPNLQNLSPWLLEHFTHGKLGFTREGEIVPGTPSQFVQASAGMSRALMEAALFGGDSPQRWSAQTIAAEFKERGALIIRPAYDSGPISMCVMRARYRAEKGEGEGGRLMLLTAGSTINVGDWPAACVDILASASNIPPKPGVPAASVPQAARFALDRMPVPRWDPAERSIDDAPKALWPIIDSIATTGRCVVGRDLCPDEVTFLEAAAFAFDLIPPSFTPFPLPIVIAGIVEDEPDAMLQYRPDLNGGEPASEMPPLAADAARNGSTWGDLRCIVAERLAAGSKDHAFARLLGALDEPLRTADYLAIAEERLAAGRSVDWPRFRTAIHHLALTRDYAAIERACRFADAFEIASDAGSMQDMVAFASAILAAVSETIVPEVSLASPPSAA